LKNYIDKYILLLPFIIWASLPVLSYNPYVRLLSLACLGLFVFVCVLEFSISKDKKIALPSVIIPLAIGYMFLTNAVFSGSEFLLRHLQFFIFIIFVPISILLIKEKPRIAKLFVYTILITNLITAGITINGLMTSNWIARSLAKSNEYTVQLAKSGLAGYSLVYSNLILLPFLIIGVRSSWTKEFRSRFLFVIILANLVSAYFLFFKAGYSMAMAASLFILVFVLITRFRMKHIPILGVAILLTVYMSKRSNIQFSNISLSKLAEGTMYYKKINDVTASVSGDKATGTVESRSDAYGKSVNTFFSNPISGIMTFDLGKRIGGHSDFMDILAQFGIFIGTLILFGAFYFPFKLLVRLKYKFRKEIVAFIFAVGIVGSLNTIPLQFSLVLLFACSYSVINPTIFRV